MAPEQKGSAESGLDRALEWAQGRRLDTSLMSGSQFVDDVRRVTFGRLQPWQRRIGDEVKAPGDTPKRTVGQTTTAITTDRPTDLAEIESKLKAAASELGLTDSEYERWKFKPKVVNKTGPRLPFARELPEPIFEKGKEYVAPVPKGERGLPKYRPPMSSRTTT